MKWVGSHVLLTQHHWTLFWVHEIGSVQPVHLVEGSSALAGGEGMEVRGFQRGKGSGDLVQERDAGGMEPASYGPWRI